MIASRLSFFRQYADEVFAEELDLLRALARIPAPSGHEDARAQFVSQWLRDAGCEGVEVDEAQNVLCFLGGAAPEGDGQLEVFSAHTDVVFEDTEPLPLREEYGRLWCPGIGDDTANLVGLMMAAKLIAHEPQLVADRSILVVANSCEEGLGNLRGTRALYDRFGRRIQSHITFDTYTGAVVAHAVGSERWRVSVDCEGGHSWANYGRPNAIVELAALIEGLAHMEVPSQARTTWNVGTIEGGSTVNSIAQHAHMLYEYRSVSSGCLATMRARFLERIAAHQREDVRVSAELVGERPADVDEPIAGLPELEARALEAVRAVTGLEPNVHPSSTDANIPLSRGIPALCVGAIRGAGAHTREEWIDPASLSEGLALILALMLG